MRVGVHVQVCVLGGCWGRCSCMCVMVGVHVCMGGCSCMC